MRFRVVNIVDAGDDNPFIFNQINRVVFPGWIGRCPGTGADLLLLLPGAGQLLQHVDNARFLVGLENIIKRLQLKGFHRMLFPRGNKNDKGLMRELADVLRQQYAIKRWNIDIEKNGVDFVVL